MLKTYGWTLHLALINFPVKLRIHIGEPLLCAAHESPEEFADRVRVVPINIISSSFRDLTLSLAAARRQNFRRARGTAG